MLAPPPASPALQLAVKSPASGGSGVFYFSIPLAAEHLFTPGGGAGDATSLGAAWRALPDNAPLSAGASVVRSVEDATARLAAGHVGVAFTRPSPDGLGGLTLYAAATLPPGTQVVVEISAPRVGSPGLKLAGKSASGEAVPLALAGVAALLV